MINFNCITLFKEMFDGFINTSICARAIKAGHISINLYDFREFSTDKHKRVDDYPFGGGAGMLIMPQPVFDCFEKVKKDFPNGNSINIYCSPAGKKLDNNLAKSLSEYDNVNILCGHYEGVDQRIIDELIDEEISIGDYVLTGGELPAMVIMDCVMRHVKGVLLNHDSVMDESFANGLLEYPQYTRPRDFRGLVVPEVLISGHHANIKKWQQEMSELKTKKSRPDLL